MAKYRKKPVVIEAIKYDGLNATEIIAFTENKAFKAFPNAASVSSKNDVIIIPTLEGDHSALVGDWVIKGVAGEFYPCKPDIFEKTYEAV